MRALVIEDDSAVREVIVRALRAGSFDVTSVASGADGDRLVGADVFDAIVVDWNLPGMSGVEIVRRLRAAGIATGVLMVTGRDAVDDRVNGLDVGADDYLVKPFHVDELLARVRAVARRSGMRTAERFTEGPVELDGKARLTKVAGVPIALSAREYALLEHLVRNAGIVLGREEIEERVWGNAFESSSNVLEVMVGRVRRKLGAHAGAIETIRGLGYRFKRSSEGAP
ncbi:MAG: two-component system response regulator FeuP [Vulcanimicrobiaceae bacterium]